jgi:3-hydroxy-9,10-secoandrosta-1,3,5(10)-triene-9,17-dione monooxygenase reductase component
VIDQSRWRTLMGHWATGVSVVTSQGDAGPRGATANALTSLSLDPLLLLVCFDRASNTLQAIRTSGRFAVNVLTTTQEDVARRFALKEPEDQKFREVAYALSHETPVIDGALAWVVCRVEEELRGGDHAIVIGAPLDGDVAEGLEPLLFYRGSYLRLGGDAI